MNRKLLGASTAAALLCAAGLWWHMSPHTLRGTREAIAPERFGAATDQRQAIPSAGPATGRAGEALTSPTGDPFLAPDLRQTFEAMLLEATDGHDMRDLAVLKTRLRTLVPRYFPAQYIVRAAALMERYVDYRVTLGGLKPPADPGEPRALRAALDARQQAREQHFTREEYEALFAQDARLDRYTLARIEIERNPALTAAQKQVARQDAERGLSDAQRAERDAATSHIHVASQTAGFDTQGTTATERYAQRRAQYGDVVATQLGQLDREEHDWQTRLNAYAAAQARNASPEQLQRLRQQLFSQQEQLRVEAALATRP